MSEFNLIQQYFNWQQPPDNVSLGVGDDGAILQVPINKELIVSVDTLISGVHFPENTPAFAIGHKALAVNLSDLAAMGAEPAWFTLALSLPAINTPWLTDFSAGLKDLAKQYGVFLIGGDTTKAPLSITIQVMGWTEKGTALRRDQAKIGDAIYVTGHLGDAAVGLAIVQNRLCLPSKHANYCIQRLNYPTPRCAYSRVIQSYTNACIDISDGLLADLRHVLQASKVGCKLTIDTLPLSPALKTLDTSVILPFVLNGGDDYELLFTVSPQKEKLLLDALQIKNLSVTKIGMINGNEGKILMDYVGIQQGYDHF